MIHAIPFKVVHPCPRPRVVPPRRATTSTSLRPSSSPARFSLSLSLSLSPSALPPRSRSLARPCAHTSTRRTQTRAPSLSRSPLSRSYYSPTGSPFLRVTTQWRCHTLAPSSNQCYCFIVALLRYCFSILGKATHRSSIRPRFEPSRSKARAGRRTVYEALFYGLALEPVFARCAFRDKRATKARDAF